MLEVSFLAFLVSGATLGRAYFDLYFLLIACVIILNAIYRQELELAPKAASEGEAAADAEGSLQYEPAEGMPYSDECSR
jgi:hypothetical protein